MGEPSKRLNFYSHRIFVKIEGFRLERLLDQAMKEGLLLQSVRMRSNTELTCWISHSDLAGLQRLARSTCRITVERRRGPVPGAKSILRRPSFLLGFVLALALVTGQSFFVRTIEVNGYRGIPEEAILACLKEEGIYKGAYRPDIDWETAEKAVYDTFPQVTWAQLVYEGQKVYLNISETDHDLYDKDVHHYSEKGKGGAQEEHTEQGESGDKEEEGGEPERRTYMDLVAVSSGYVESINPYYGLALVEAGDYVKKGQILITGCVPITPTTFSEEEKTGQVYFVNAEGEVWAKVPYHLTMNQERYLWGQPSPDGKTVADRVEKTDEQAKKRVQQQIRLWAAENLPEKAEILNNSLKFSRSGNIIEVSVLLEVRQQIASQQEEYIGETDTDTTDH